MWPFSNTFASGVTRHNDCRRKLLYTSILKIVFVGFSAFCTLVGGLFLAFPSLVARIEATRRVCPNPDSPCPGCGNATTSKQQHKHTCVTTSKQHTTRTHSLHEEEYNMRFGLVAV